MQGSLLRYSTLQKVWLCGLLDMIIAATVLVPYGQICGLIDLMICDDADVSIAQLNGG